MQRRWIKPLQIAAPALSLLALLSAAPASAAGPNETLGVPPVPQYGTRDGVVAVAHPLAAQAGNDILAQGGNAIDAAAAIFFALNVVEPQFLGIGGGGFMMIHVARTGETFAIDSREKAPAAATPTMFGNLDFGTASTSGVSVGVPGPLRGLELALSRWGTMPFSTVIQRGIDLAEKGHRINPILEGNIGDLRTVKRVSDTCTATGAASTAPVAMTDLQQETRDVFRPGTPPAPLKTGTLLVQKDLANTFKLIAQYGADAFYNPNISPIPQAIVDAAQRTRVDTSNPCKPYQTIDGLAPTVSGSSLMTLDDLRNYRAVVRTPVTGYYRGYKIVQMPPPSSGGLTIIQMLKMLERFPLGDVWQGFGFGAKNTLHVMIEAMRLGFADRAWWMGDSDFVPVPINGLLDPTYVASRSALINLNSRMSSAVAGNPLAYDNPPVLGVRPGHGRDADEPGETTHFAVVDRQGNIVTYTTTIESTFGAGIMVPGYGFMLNNELTDYNMVPTYNASTGNPGANDVAGNKRPRSSMVPTILFKNGRPFAAYGSPGGATIINSVFQTTLNLVDHGMTIQEAINAPRISVTSAGGTVSCERGPFWPLGHRPLPELQTSVIADLKAMGHTFGSAGDCTATAIGSVQGVIIDLTSGLQFGGADPRRQGTVLSQPRH
jgi:gamma-glutamyltranspeptidase/glutathione hydrolase